MKNVRMQKAQAMGTPAKAGNGGGNHFKSGNASSGNPGGTSKKMPSSGVACNHGTYAKPKGAK